jgi:hypothetical protein
MSRTGTLLLVLLIPSTASLLQAADKAELQTVLNREILAPGQALREVQNYVEPRVPRMKTYKNAEEWNREADRLRAAVLERVVYRGEAAAWRDTPLKVEWSDTIKGGPGFRIKKLRYETDPLYQPGETGHARLERRVVRHGPVAVRK